jgi:hypothetical protein
MKISGELSDAVAQSLSANVDQCLVTSTGGYVVYKGKFHNLSLSHHLTWPLLTDLFFVVPGVNWSLPSMLGRHTVAFRTGTSPLCHIQLIVKLLILALIVF